MEEQTEEQSEPEHPKLPRQKLLLIVVPIIVLSGVAFVASALTPTLAAKHPLLLILMEARNRNLILAERVSFWPFLIVATFRRTLSDPLYYLLGKYYGDRAIRWLEVNAGMGSYARLMERIFKKASYPAVFLFPGAIVCAMAGVTGMRFGVFMLLNVAGTISAVVALKVFGNVFSAPVEGIVGFFNRNLVVTTAISIALVALSIVVSRWEHKERMSIEELEGDEPAEGSDVEEGVEADGEAGTARD
ncbi:MAG: DedA family protein [Acidimicrobiales bacterium]